MLFALGTKLQKDTKDYYYRERERVCVCVEVERYIRLLPLFPVVASGRLGVLARRKTFFLKRGLCACVRAFVLSLIGELLHDGGR